MCVCRGLSLGAQSGGVCVFKSWECSCPRWEAEDVLTPSSGVLVDVTHRKKTKTKNKPT